MCPLSVHQPAARLRYWPAQVARRLDPLLDHDLGAGQRLLIGRAVGSAARQLRHLGDERLVFVAPIQDDLVAYVSLHRYPPDWFGLALPHVSPPARPVP